MGIKINKETQYIFEIDTKKIKCNTSEFLFSRKLYLSDHDFNEMFKLIEEQLPYACKISHRDMSEAQIKKIIDL